MRRATEALVHRDAPTGPEQVESAQFNAEGVITNPQSPHTLPEPTMEQIQVVNETRGRLGDPRYLSTIKDCWDKEIELFGLKTPQEVNVMAEIKAKREEYRKLPTEELYRLHRERLALLPKPNGSSNP